MVANIRKDPALLWLFLLVSVQSLSTTPEASRSSITAKPLDHSETASHLTPSGAHKTNQQTSSGYLKATLTRNNAGILTIPATTSSSVSLSAETSSSVSLSAETSSSVSLSAETSSSVSLSAETSSSVSLSAEIEDTSNTQTAVTAGMVSSHTPLKVPETMKPTVQPLSREEPLITSLGPSAMTSASKLASLLLGSTSKSSFTPTASTTTFSNAPTNSTLVSISSYSKTTSWPIKRTEMSTKAEFSSSTSHSQSSSMKISHSSTKFPVTITPSSSATEGTSTLSPTPTSTKSSSTKTKSPVTKTSTTTETTLPFSATSNSTTNSSVPVFPLVPKMTTKSFPTARTSLPPNEKPSEKGLQPCSTNHRSGVVNQCLIAIAVLALIGTIFMVSTVILCTKLSARKYRYRVTRESQQGTELVCISGLLPENNGTYWRDKEQWSNGALLSSTLLSSPAEYDSDGDMDDNLTLNSFLPENDSVV